jgi:hypothetical protein
MSKQVRFRRGTTAQHAVFTGPAGEITVDTDKKVTVVHDGVTAGGIPTARADRPRGWTTTGGTSGTTITTLITSTGTWTKDNKTDLKRIIVWAWGGGGAGGSQAGGGAGGYGMVVREASAVTSNVTVTIGAPGGATSFGPYITCTAGAAGSSQTGGAPGVASGTGVYNLGAQGGAGGYNFGSTGSGGGIGRGNYNTAAKGYTGSGGGGNSAAGTQGGMIIQEIYGLY